MTDSHSHTPNEAALKRELAKRDFELVSIDRRLPDGRIEARAYKLQPVSAASGEPLYVPVLVTLEITLDKKGHIQTIEGDTPELKTMADAAQSVQILMDNQQLSEAGEPLAPGATHQIEIDKKGRRIVKRRRFSAY